jgi:hypothetical protein
MSKEIQKSEDLEVVTANSAESKAIVAKCGERIAQHAVHLKKGERMNDRWRLLIGLELSLAKPHMDHGEFEPFTEKLLPDYGKRTAERWKNFAETAIAKSDTVSFLKLLPEKAQNGGISAREFATLDKELNDLLGEQSYDDWTDENAPKKAKGGLRKIKFHCPHCSTENTGLFGREITCVNGQCKKKITAKPDVDPEVELKRLREEATEAANSLADEGVVFFETRMAQEKISDIAFAANIEKAAWNRLAALSKQLSRFVADAKKIRKAPKSTKS